MTLTQLTLESAQAVRGMSDNIPSPCLSVCRVDATSEVCDGCWRTLDEIARWGSSSNPEKQAIWALIEQRITTVIASTSTP